MIGIYNLLVGLIIILIGIFFSGQFEKLLKHPKITNKQSLVFLIIMLFIIFVAVKLASYIIFNMTAIEI